MVDISFGYIKIHTPSRHLLTNPNQIDPRLQVPIPALLFVGFICCLLSLINLGSTVAFQALIALPLFALYISYLIPIVLLTLRQIANEHPVYGPWRLGRWSVPVKLFSICYLVYVIIFLPFPTVRSVTPLTMNYAGPVMLGVVLVALADWCMGGWKRFRIVTVPWGGRMEGSRVVYEGV